MRPRGPVEGSLVIPVLDWGFLREKSCPCTFGHRMGGGLIPLWLRAQSPGCRETRLETEPVTMEGHAEKSRSYSLVRSSHPGIL